MESPVPPMVEDITVGPIAPKQMSKSAKKKKNQKKNKQRNKRFTVPKSCRKKVKCGFKNCNNLHLDIETLEIVFSDFRKKKSAKCCFSIHSNGEMGLYVLGEEAYETEIVGNYKNFMKTGLVPKKISGTFNGFEWYGINIYENCEDCDCPVSSRNYISQMFSCDTTSGAAVWFHTRFDRDYVLGLCV